MTAIEATGRKRFRLSAMPGRGSRYGCCECCNLPPIDSYILTIEKEMLDDPDFSGETWWRHSIQLVGHHECLMLVVRAETIKGGMD